MKMIKLMEISGIESAFLPNDFWLTEAYPPVFFFLLSVDEKKQGIKTNEDDEDK